MTAISIFRFHIKLVNDLYVKGYSGRVVHGAFLQFLREYNDELATYLHEYQGKQPYSLTEMDFRKMGDQWVAFFDVHTMDEDLIQNLVGLLISDKEHEIFIIDRFCPVFKIEYQKEIIPDPKELPVNTRIWLNFDNLTIFSNSKRNANTDPYPHLDVIWRQIIDTYSRLVDEISDTDQAILIQYLLNQLATPKFKFKSKHIRLGHKIKVTGFEGSIMFMIEDNTHLEMLEPMLKLIEIWGIGGKTTMGFGRLSINIYLPEEKEKTKKAEGKPSLTKKN